MGLSLSVLVALAFILPGAAFVFGLSRLHSPTKPTTLLDQHVSVGLALTVLSTLTIHAAWLALMRALMAAHGLPEPAPAQLFALLAGDVTSKIGREGLASIQGYPVRIASYLVSLTVLAWYTGKAADRKLRKQETASWFDLLRPKGAAFVWLTTDLQIGDKCYLYAGWVKQFSVAKDGTIERVVLGYAVRKPMQDNPPGEGVPVGNGGWIEIPGEHCILQMAGARTVNVDYFFPDAPPDVESDEQAAANDPDQPTPEWELSQVAKPDDESTAGGSAAEAAGDAR